MTSAHDGPADRADLPAVLVRAGVDQGPLGSRVRRGVALTAGSRVLLQLLQVGSTAVLARLLTPTDYGLGALVAVVTGLAAIVVDMGVQAAVVRRPGLDGRYLSTAFWLSWGVGLSTAVLVVAAGVPLAAFVEEPALAGLVALSSLTFVLSAHAVHLAVLQRALAFGILTRTSISAALTGLATSLVAAWSGLGAASLVLGPIAERVVVLVSVWAAVRWVPRARISREDARDVWHFGRGLLGTNVLSYAVNSADRLLVARVVSVADLGFYNRATNLMMLPIQQTGRTLSGVFYPALAAMADDVVRLRAAWLRLVHAAWLLGLPSGVGIGLVAPALVEVLYGPRWDAVVPILEVLSVGVPFLVLAVTTGPAYQALGRTGLQLRVGVVNAVLALAALAVGVQWGVHGVAVAAAVRAVVGLTVSLGVLLPVLGLSPRDLVRAVWRPTVAVLPTAAAVLVARATTHDLPTPLALAVQVLTGVLVHVVALWLLDRRALLGLMGKRFARGRLGRVLSRRRRG